MVFGFLCHSVSSTPCRLLYTAVYGDDVQSASTKVVSAEGSLRTMRKEQLLEVACRVQSEYGFRLSTQLTTRVPRGPGKDDTISTGEDCSRGLFRLSAGDPFPTVKVAVWQVKDECAYVLICETDENKLLAESVLQTITRLMAEHVTSLEQRNAEIMLKAEKATAVLHLFLPNGQLQFMNHKVLAQNEKQLEKLITVK